MVQVDGQAIDAERVIRNTMSYLVNCSSQLYNLQHQLRPKFITSECHRIGLL